MGKKNKINENLQILLDKASVALESIDFWEERINKIFDKVDYYEAIDHLNKKQEQELDFLYKEMESILSRFRMEVDNINRIEVDIEKFVDEEK